MYMEPSSLGGPAVHGLSAAWSQVAALVTAIDSGLGKWLMDNYRIGLTDYRAALQLSRASKSELRITELAQKVGLNQSSVTRLVERMEAKGLVIRDTCPDDGRGVYAVLTELGIGTVMKIREPYEARISELLQNAAKDYPQLGSADLNHSFETINTLL